jgi:NADPH-dependent glutamate synthase beta subunit-like oxidoreductase
MDQDGLHELENQCIQEHAPACMATCPARVDVRGICAEMEKGNFPSALKILRKAIPFPGIISRICEEPCREKCIRKDAGEAIAIASLERACVDYGGSFEKPAFLPRRDNRLAVIGGGLFGLTAACDLAKKGYQVIVFEKNGELGGNILRMYENRLTLQIIQSDFDYLSAIGIQVFLNCPIEKIISGDSNKFKINGQEFDAVLLAMGANPSGLLDIEMDKDGIKIDPVTYSSNMNGVFSGGHAARGQDATVRDHIHSPIFILADGHRVATSIDRYFQNVSMTAARIKEGSYETQLFTSVEGVLPSPAIKLTGPGFTHEEATSEAARCLQCQCLECVKVCEYLKEYGSYPKRYIREIYNNLSIVKGERRKNQFINSCSLCGLCGEVCPTDLNMATVCLESRQEMVNQNRMPPSAHDFALRDMQFSNSEPISLFQNAPGTTSSRYLFFPGCQLTASNPDYVEKVYSWLLQQPEFDGNAGVGLALRCCGAPARWAGRQDLFEESRKEFLKEYDRLGKPEVILACSSCYQVFKESFPDISIRSLWTLLDGSDLVKEASGKTKSTRVSIHDPCTTRYETAIQDSVRNITSELGNTVEELPLSREKTECCSYGGHMWLANRPLSEKVIDRRIAESDNAFVTYCVMCRDFFSRHGKQTYHILDLLFNPEMESFTPPDYSTRHRNREYLKNHLLKTIWGEKMPVSEPSAFELNIPKNVRAILEDRLILEEDIVRVLAHVEETGLSLQNEVTGRWLAYYCPSYVTYWVEYTKGENEYTIYNAYSHRMSITEVKPHD